MPFICYLGLNKFCLVFQKFFALVLANPDRRGWGLSTLQSTGWLYQFKKVNSKRKLFSSFGKTSNNRKYYCWIELGIFFSDFYLIAVFYSWDKKNPQIILNPWKYLFYCIDSFKPWNNTYNCQPPHFLHLTAKYSSPFFSTTYPLDCTLASPPTYLSHR